ncbi:hypothetical protein SH449x_003569 [Pirellulaceae bacterium SH449]|jgi:hypothetical protein
MTSENGMPATCVHDIVRQLSFTGNSHQIQRAEALGFVFLVGPKADGKTWRWATWSDGDKSYHWHDCDTRETAIAHCNRRWRELLEPYLEV